MKKILQTGLALGISQEACLACNIDFSWMFDTPSSFLWLDKVVITNTLWNLIQDYDNVSKNKDRYGHLVYKQNRAVKHIYQILKSLDLVEIISDDVITTDMNKMIYSQIDSDISLMKNYKIIKKEVGHTFEINNIEYCIPSLWTLYAANILAYKFNSTYGLTPDYLNYLRTLLPLKYNSNLSTVSKSSCAIHDVLEIAIPQINIWPDYVHTNPQKCNICINMQKCEKGYLKDIEKNLFNLMNYRERDEIQQLCEMLNKICDEKFKEQYEINSADLLRELNIEKIKIQRKLRTTNNNIKKWSRLLTTISTGFALGTVFEPLLAPIAAGTSFVAASSEYMRTRSIEKYSWINLWNNVQNNM